MRLLRPATIVLAVIAVSLAGCGGGHDQQPAPSPSPVPAIPQAAWVETTITATPSFTLVSRLLNRLGPGRAWAQAAGPFTFVLPADPALIPVLNVAVDNAGLVGIRRIEILFTVSDMLEIRNRLVDPQDPRYCWPAGQPKPTSPPLAVDPRTGLPFDPLNPGGCNFPNSPPQAVRDAQLLTFTPGVCAVVDGVEYCSILTTLGMSREVPAGQPAIAPGARAFEGSRGDGQWRRPGTKVFDLKCLADGVEVLARQLALTVQ